LRLAAHLSTAYQTTVKRPWGFKRFTKRQGFHSLYLVTTESETPVKVGIAADPLVRFNCHQSSNFVALRLHRAWWLPGRPISKRIEKAFKEHFNSRNVRGEWFDIPLAEAEAFIEAGISKLCTWGVPEIDVVELMDHRARQHFPLPPDAPSPLRGMRDDWRPRHLKTDDV
jgi:hypothetical protein